MVTVRQTKLRKAHGQAKQLLVKAGKLKYYPGGAIWGAADDVVLNEEVRAERFARYCVSAGFEVGYELFRSALYEDQKLAQRRMSRIISNWRRFIGDEAKKASNESSPPRSPADDSQEPESDDFKLAGRAILALDSRLAQIERESGITPPAAYGKVLPENVIDFEAWCLNRTYPHSNPPDAA